jgi:hypothetical protein
MKNLHNHKTIFIAVCCLLVFIMIGVTVCSGASLNSSSSNTASSATSISPSSFQYTTFSLEKPNWCSYMSHVYALQSVLIAPNDLDKHFSTPSDTELYSIKNSSVLEKIAYKALYGIYYSNGFYEGIYISDYHFDWNGASYTMNLPNSGGLANIPSYAYPLPTTDAELGASIGNSGDMAIYNPAKGANSKNTKWIIVTSHGYVFAAYAQTAQTSSQAK